MRETFRNARLSFSDNVLLFPGPQPVLAYLESHSTWLNLEADEQTRGQAAIHSVLQGRFRHGPWTVSKRTAFLMAER